MKPHRLLAVVIAMLLLPFPSSALGFKQFNHLPRDQQAEVLIKAVDKIVADVARVNPALSETIRSYFSVAPAGSKLLPPGMTVFGGSVVAVQKLALDGKLDLDKVQIEGMLLDIIKTDLMPQQVSQNTPASAPVPNGPPQSSAPSVKDQWELALGIALDQWSKYLDQSERETRQKLQEVECRVIRLHDGRPVLKGDHGWYAITEREALEKYRECLAQHGLSNPDRTAGKQSDSPATTPPPAAAPSSPPTSSTDDAPFGSGGFITPPTSFNALLCVSADVANNSSWSKPEAGSKMAAFKDLAASYIISVAKPGWEYWIMQGQYERFDPAVTSSGAQFVSVVSPDSGRFDEFDPKCPSGYAAFWVPVHH